MQDQWKKLKLMIFSRDKLGFNQAFWRGGMMLESKLCFNHHSQLSLSWLKIQLISEFNLTTATSGLSFTTLSELCLWLKWPRSNLILSIKISSMISGVRLLELIRRTLKECQHQFQLLQGRGMMKSLLALWRLLIRKLNSGRIDYKA